MIGELSVFAKMKLYMGKSKLSLALVFAITVSYFHGGDILLPASFSKNTIFYGKQEKDGIKTAGKVVSMRSSTWAAPISPAARFILLNSSLADMNPNWNIIKTFNRPSSNNRLPRRFESIVRSISHRHGVDPNLVWAVMKAESNFNPRARSRAGARGLMQLMPGTARQHNVADIYDPADNINGGVRHLRLLLNRFRGNVRLALAAYNAGARPVDRFKDIPPYAETRKYVRRVLAYYQLYSGRSERSDRDVMG